MTGRPQGPNDSSSDRPAPQERGGWSKADPRVIPPGAKRERREAEPLTASWRPTAEADDVDGDEIDEDGAHEEGDDLFREHGSRSRKPRRTSGHSGPGRSGSSRTGAARGRAGRKRFSRYGWGLYALPLLIVITALALFQVAEPGEKAGGGSGGGSSAASEPVVKEAPPGQKFPSDMFTATLPPGGTFPASGSGTYDVLPGTSPQVGQGNLEHYTAEVETGIELPEGNDTFGKLVQSTLSDPRSWTNPKAATPKGPLALQRVDSSGPKPDFRVTLVSQQTARRICGYQEGLPFDTSCKVGDREYINVARWVRGSVAFEGDMGAYRHYAINHEVGHAFGLRHVPCPAQGATAPTMMQQTFSVSNNELHDLNSASSQGTPIPKNGFVCKPSAWPFPVG